LSRGHARSGGPAPVSQRNPAEPDIHSKSPMSAAHKLTPPSEPERGGAASPAALYETHLRFVWRNLRRFGVPYELLEDAAQDVFVTVHRRWESFDPRASSVETWLFGIAIRVAHYHRRTVRRRLLRLLPWLKEGRLHEVPSDHHGPLELAEKREATLLLDRLLDELNAKHREILVLVDVEEVAVPEAARILSINVNTAYTRLRAARQRFQASVRRLQAKERRPKGGEYGV